MNELKVWAARDTKDCGFNKIYLYDNCPVKDKENGVWCGAGKMMELPIESFPEIIWENSEPTAMSLRIDKFIPEDGDIVTEDDNQPFIFKDPGDNDWYGDCYAGMTKDGMVYDAPLWCQRNGCRLCNMAERLRIFDALKKDGKRWDAKRKKIVELKVNK